MHAHSIRFAGAQIFEVLEYVPIYSVWLYPVQGWGLTLLQPNHDPVL